MLAFLAPQRDNNDRRWNPAAQGPHRLAAEDRKPILVQVVPGSQTSTAAMDAINSIISKEDGLRVKQEQVAQANENAQSDVPLSLTVVTTEGDVPTAAQMTSVANTVTVPSSSVSIPASIASSLSSILGGQSGLSLTNLLGMPSPQVGTFNLGQGGLALSSPSVTAPSNASNNMVVYTWPQPTTLGNGVAQVITSAMGPLMTQEVADVKPHIDNMAAVAGMSHSPVNSPNAPSSASETFSPPVTPMSQAPDSPQSPQEGDQQQSAGGGKIRARRALSGNNKDDKVCGVCGAKALGCNFDAISCESCKAFFRRNALKSQHKCLFKGACEITVNTRRFCQFCRLQKCFAIGMKSELILGDEDKKKRALKVQDNRKTRKNTPAVDAATGWQQAVEQVLQAAVAQESASSSPPREGATSQEPTVTVPPVALSEVTLEGMPNTSNLLTISKYMRLNDSTIPSHLDTYLLRRLTDDENHAIQELVQVYDLSFTVDLEPLIHIKQLDPSLNQLVNQSSITVLRLIKFAKRLNDFVRLPQECQIGILKGTWIHMLLLRSVALYDTERDVWVTPRGDIPTEILKNATGFVQLHDDHVCYCKNIKQIVRDDLTIVVVLLIIVLFSPEGPHVITREVVSNLQDKYLLLLKHYLESKYTYTRAADMFPQLMSKMKELKELAEVHGKYLLDVNPREIEPIMLEILDLK